MIFGNFAPFDFNIDFVRESTRFRTMSGSRNRRSRKNFFTETRPTDRGTMRLHLRWGRIFGLAFVLLVSGYLLGGLGVFILYKERKRFTELKLVDVYLLRRDEIRTKQGEHDIAEGLEAIKNRDFRAAYSYLRSGVSRSPSNLEGRLTLIALTAPSSPDQALHIFEDGLQYGKDDFGYLRAYGQFLLGTRHDEKLRDLAQSLLLDLDEESENSRLMAFFLFRAQIYLGELAKAGETFEQYGLFGSMEGTLFAADALERASQPDKAIEILENFRSRYQNADQAPLVGKLVHLYLENNRIRDATQLSLNFALKDPLSWRPRRMLLDCYEKAGRDADIERESTAMVREFRDETEAITALAQFAEETGRIKLARQAYEVALEDGLEVARFGLLFIETYLSAKRYDEVLVLCEEIEEESPAWLEQYRPEFSGMRSIAAYAQKNSQLGDIYRNQFLGAVGRRADVLRAVAAAYKKAGLHSQAASMLEEASNIETDNELALSDLIDLQVKLGDSRELTSRVKRLLGLRRPGYDVFEAVEGELGSDRFIFASEREDLLQSVSEVLEEVAPESLAALRMPPPPETPNQPSSES